MQKVLIANRGEIAVRIIKTARAMGFRCVAVYSDADLHAPHVRLADQAVNIGPPPSRESYLNIERIIEAAKRSGADAIHPGYGFLAENHSFAARCAEEGLTFIGPPAEAIRLMGDKAESKKRMQSADVPVIPGYNGESQDPAECLREAEGVGFPLLVKAVAGGGGRGMRIVREAQELSEALKSARAEAESAFGNGDILLERLIDNARHVEIQVFADLHGNVVYLGERECSAQRRHQKIIEESPSPVVDSALRERMGRSAVAAAKAIGYVGAGTVEFILEEGKGFYFLEMNTRLQVEHPVTELITGQDLVAWQLLVACGEKLPLEQQQIKLHGHAIEARIYAEDPYKGFLPQTGRVLHFRPPVREGVRIDAGIEEGQDISAYYDPLLAKIIAFGDDRQTARRRLIAAIDDSALLGLTTNREFLVALLRDKEFVEGKITTATIDRRFSVDPPTPMEPKVEMHALAAVLMSLQGRDLHSTVGQDGGKQQIHVLTEPWRSSGAGNWKLTLTEGEKQHRMQVSPQGKDAYRVTVGEKEQGMTLLALQEHAVRFETEGVQKNAHFAFCDNQLHLEIEGVGVVYEEPRADESQIAGGDVDDNIKAPISGQVVKVCVELGDRVVRGECVALLEAMKMEHRVVAKADGVVAHIAVSQGEQVSSKQLIAKLNLSSAEPSNRSESDD